MSCLEKGGQGVKLWGVTRRLLGAFGVPVGASTGEAPSGRRVGDGGGAEETGGGRWGGNRFGRGECGCAGGAGGGGGLCSRREPAGILERLNDAGRSGEIGDAPTVDFLARPVLESFEELEVGLLGERPWTLRSRVVKAETYSWGDPICRRSARASKAEKALLAGRNWAIRESRKPFQERSRGWAGSEQQRRHHNLAAPMRKVEAVRRREASVETLVLVKYSSRSHRKFSRVHA